MVEPTAEPAALLLFGNLGLSVGSCLALLLACRHYPRLAALAFLIGLDALLAQGSAVLLLLEPAAHPPACRLAALLSLLSLLLLLASAASLALSPSRPLSPLLHLIAPPLLALALALPFAFPQVASVTYIQERYTCGFINLAKAYAVLILLVGFVIPLSALVYFTWKNYPPFSWFSYRRGTPSNGKPVIFFVSLCSVLLIPHIIQVNITHFSSNVLKSKSGNELVHTSAYDTISIWLRYEFNVVTPIVIIMTLKDLRDEYKSLLAVCRTRTNLVKYVKSIKEEKKREGKRNTPVLYISPDGLMLLANGCVRAAEIPLPEEASSSKAESSVSTSMTDSSRTSREKRTPGNKKIVRFAHSVKEISWKDPGNWESPKESSKERL